MNKAGFANAVDRVKNTLFSRPYWSGQSVIAVLVVVFSVLRWKVILAGILSFLLTLVDSIAHLRVTPAAVRAPLPEYWIAGLAWIALCIYIARRLGKSKSRQSFAKSLFSTISPSWIPTERTVRKSTIGVVILSGFFWIALLCPLLAPFDPNDQGDLETTRLIAPLQTAIARDVAVATQPEDRSSGWIETVLGSVNKDLIGHRMVFSRSYGEAERVPPAADRYKVLFLFGTDALGRDVFSRVLYGTRISLGIGIIVAALSLIVGMVVGLTSGFAGGLVDKILMRTIDILLSVPSLVLIIALFAMLGGSITIMIFALAVTGWMGVARLVRGEVVKLREREFILSAKLLGVSPAGIMRTHILPNILPVILTASLLQLVNSIMGEAALSFLGLGIQSPTASWGNMIGESLIYLRSAWWVGLCPGIALSVFAISAQLIVEGLQECQK